MEKKKKVYIIGHKNPDTDSICSAIAYAYIKNRTEKGEFKAKRAGQLNEETEFVLRRFGIQPPGYLPDAGTQINEIDIHEIAGVPANISVRNAWELMNKENVVTLPVTTKDNDLEGLITVSDIAQSYMDAYDASIMSQARTQYRRIAETLDGTVIVGNEHAYFTKGRVVIGSFNPDMMENQIQTDDLVILGNRADDQLLALEMGVSCMVVGLDAAISNNIKKLAEGMECIIISSPHDTYTIARLINQSIPIKHLMTTQHIITFHTNDFLDDIKDVMKRYRNRDFPVLNKKQKYVGTISRRNLIGNNKKKLILVDHNEVSQAVDNVGQAEILEIIDHHRLGTLETMSPIMFRNQPVGCTATIMYQIFGEKQLEIPEDIAGILCAAIISDTLMFRSPTCTDFDVEAATRLSAIAGIDMHAFATEMFKAGSNLAAKNPEEIFYQDFKKFILEHATFGVGQITSLDKEELARIKDKMLPFLENECGKQGLSQVYFMLTGILEESTELLFCGSGAMELVQHAFHPKELTRTSAVLPGVVSRKKQLIPAFMLVLQQQME